MPNQRLTSLSVQSTMMSSVTAESSSRVVPSSEPQGVTLDIDETNQFVTSMRWLNFPLKQLAQSRLKSVKILSLPYIFATQKIGSGEWAMDGAQASSLISDEGGNSKFFNSSGQAWRRGASDTVFHYLSPADGQASRIGTFFDLMQKGLNWGHISDILDIADSDEDTYESKAEEKIFRDRNRATLYVFFKLGIGLPKDDRAADAVTRGIAPEQLHESILEQMTYSAGSDMLFLNAGLRLGINPDEPSKRARCRPISWAIVKGNRAAVDRLLPLTSHPGADHAFLLRDDAFPRDHALLRWALDFKPEPK